MLSCLAIVIRTEQSLLLSLVHHTFSVALLSSSTGGTQIRRTKEPFTSFVLSFSLSWVTSLLYPQPTQPLDTLLCASYHLHSIPLQSLSYLGSPLQLPVQPSKELSSTLSSTLSVTPPTSGLLTYTSTHQSIPLPLA